MFFEKGGFVETIASMNDKQWSVVSVLWLRKRQRKICVNKSEQVECRFKLGFSSELFINFIIFLGRMTLTKYLVHGHSRKNQWNNIVMIRCDRNSLLHFKCS